jgi:hypothetical protein
LCPHGHDLRPAQNARNRAQVPQKLIQGINVETPSYVSSLTAATRNKQIRKDMLPVCKVHEPVTSSMILRTHGL